MKLIEKRSKIGALCVKIICKILGGHFGHQRSKYFADPKNPRCSICDSILTEENHFFKLKKDE